MGFPVIDDANGPMRAGAGYINMNIAADGTRVSSSRAFLRQNLDRPNLTLLLNTNVTKVLFDGDRARGVEIVTADGTRNVRATGEVILSAGTIHSARLLMLSGIGDATQLRKLGIKPVANLRGVGQNLQDHAIVSGVVYQYKGKMPDRRADSNAVEAELYLSSGVARPRMKASRSRRRSFNQLAVAMFGLPVGIGAMHPSSKATIWVPTAISPPLCGRSKRPASWAARLHSTASVKRRSYQAPKPPADRT